ncbi:MAG: ATP-binding protein [bacterium]|nr:ATP-binding protein [bacterium]
MLAQYMLGINNILSSSIISILLLFNLIVFHIYVRFNQFFLHEREIAVHAEQLSLIAQNMEEQKKLIDDFYEEKHDLINKLTALRGKMSQESAATALSELDRILNDYHNLRNLCASGNTVIDALINAKYATAQTYGIAFWLHICVPEDLPVAARDLGVVIGNALDNAITAVRECRLAEKTIQISMSVRKNAFVMVMKNPYEHPLKKARNGELLSTKPDSRKHGYGLRSIRRTAESYAGDMITDTDNGQFSLTVILNFSEF